MNPGVNPSFHREVDRDTAGPAVHKPYAIVAAHPDDEVLWFGSLLAGASKVIVCYGDDPGNPGIGARRRAAMVNFPLPNLCFLDLPEGGFFRTSDWKRPALSDTGLVLSSEEDRARYDDNFRRLAGRIGPLLEGIGVAVTHNPWGEYGHEDHSQVFQVVHALMSGVPQSCLYVSSYISARSAALARACRDIYDYPTCFTADTPQTLTEEIKHLYVSHGCWTWKPDWCAPTKETFYSVRKRLPA